MNYIIAVALFMMVVLMGGMLCYTILLTQQRMNNQFDVQMQSAMTSRNSHIINMPYKELLAIVNEIINFYVSDQVINLGLTRRSEEELSVMFDDILLDVCAKTKSSLSTDVITAITFYIDEKYLNIYIKDTARLTMVARTFSKFQHPANNKGSQGRT